MRGPRVEGGALVWEDRAVPLGSVLGLHESHDPLTDRVHLLVIGPRWRVRVGEGYGAVRRGLRAGLPRVPFTADWSETGRFPTRGRWLPSGWRVPVALAAWLPVVISAAWVWGQAWGIGLAVVGAAVIARLRGAVEVTARGLRLGPVWAPRLPWHRVRAVRFAEEGAVVLVRAMGERGVASARLPRDLWPACRARVRRLGGLVAEPRAVDDDERYLAWRAPAQAAPWVALGVAWVAAPFAADPFVTVAIGGLVAGVAAAVGAAVDARVEGWGSAAVVWMTVAYGLGLLTLWVALLAG